MVLPCGRRQLCLLLSTLLCISIVLLLALSTPQSTDRVQGLLSRIKGAKQKPQDKPRKPDFYHWKTRSSFEPVSFDDWRNASTSELCSSFPSNLLNEVQPVLKTGHGVLEQRVQPQLDTGLACLDNLLTFSDVTEQFHNLHMIDVLEDIPQELVESNDQLEPYRRLQECVAVGGTDCGSVMTRKEAWSMDKFKFLPMVTRAWKMRPERRWYVFFEADTMLFWDNILRLVSNFDADFPFYFGSPSPGMEKTWFAFGGAGFILSREAMRRLVSNDWDSDSGEYLGSKLTEMHWDTLLHDCCGDSVMGWALHKEGVDLSGLWPMWNPHPPHGVPFSKLYWCQPMIGMHKPNEADVQDLFRWEFGYRQYDRPLLYRDLAVSYYNFTSLGRREDWNNGGFDGFPAPVPGEHYSQDPKDSADACSTACEAHPDCMQWTHHGDKCTFVRSFRLGGPKTEDDEKADKPGAPTVKYTAGWTIERIEAWIEHHPCESAQWVTPSIERIF